MMPSAPATLSRLFRLRTHYFVHHAATLNSMRRLPALITLAAATVPLTAQAQQPFTLQRILSAPYALSLTAAPVGNRFAWVENAEGVRNIWVGAVNEPARQLTHYTEDDGQDISGLAWSPDAQTLAYVYGAEFGNSGKPANPAHLQRETALHILLRPLAANAPARDLGEGRSPLFTRDGEAVFFLRGGKIWSLCLSSCHSEKSEKSASRSIGQQASTQLVYDRGSAHSLTLSPDGTLLAYVSSRPGTNGEGHSFLALFNLTTKELTFPAPSTGNDSAPAFSPDGKQLAWLRTPFTEAPEFASNRTSPNPWSIQLHDPTAHTTRTVYSPEPNQPGSVLPHLATGEPRLFWAAPANTSTRLSSRPKSQQSATKPGGPSFAASSQRVGYRLRQQTTVLFRYEPPALAAESTYARLIFYSEADGWLHLYSFDPGTNTSPTLLTPGDFEVEDPSVSRDGRVLIWCSSAITKDDSGDADRRHIWILNLTEPGSAPKRMTQGSNIQTHPVPAADGSRIAVLVSDARPMHAALLEFRATDAAMQGIGSSQTNTPPSVSATPPAETLFRSTDGLSLHGQLFLPHAPPNEKVKHPAILFFHGGPRRQMLLGYPAMDYYSNAYAFNQYLASRGYIVLSVNYRGGIGYGLNFRQCEHCGADGAAEYADALAAAAYLRSRPDVDPSRIGIWGGSYGGYFVALALARNSDIFAAGVDFHGVHEWAAEDNAKADWLDRPGTMLAEQERIAAVAHASSPMADIAKWRSPVLLIHGDDDPDVAYAQTPMLADALRARKVPVEELIFPDEVHGFILHKDWLAAYQAASDFFDRALKPLAAPAHAPGRDIK